MSGQQGEPAIGHSHVGEFRNNNQNSLVGEVRSNNQCQQAGGGAVGAVTHDGDANANQLIKTGEGGSDGGGESTGRDVDTLPPLMSQSTEVSQTVTEEQQNHIIIWGTDSQCDDPDLAEFEMLECQELEAYLVEEEEEEEEKVCEGVGLGGGVKEGAGQILLDQPVSIVDIVSDSREGGGRRTIQRGSSEQDVITMGSGGTRGTVECVARTEFSSENHALVSRLSTMSSLDGSLVSALDTAGRKQATATDSWHVPSGPSVPDKTISEDLTLASQSCTTISDRSRASQQSKQPQAPSKSTIQLFDLNLNQNTTVRSEEVVVPEAQVSNNVVVGQCKCQQNMEEDQGNEEHNNNNNMQQRYREAGGTGGKAVEDHQDARGTGGKAAEDHKEARGTGGKAAEDHKEARGTGGKAVEDHQDARGTGGKAEEDHQDARGTGGKAAEDHKEARGTGGKAVEDHQETRGTGGKAVEDDKEARGTGGKAVEDHKEATGTGGKAADDHEGARGSGGKAAEDHKVIPPDMNHNSPAKSGTNGIQSVEPRSLKKHGSFGQSMKKTTSFEQSMKKTTLFENTTKKSASFDRSLKKEPFLDRTSMKEASFDRTLRKQGSFEHSSSPSSLEGRKPWGSPSRSPSRPATPPWSPRRPAPSSPAKTSSRPPSCTSPAKTRNRASSLDRSDSPQRGITSGLKAPSKVCVTSSIPKPSSPQPPADPKRASPLKPKPARPKIITYVRKTPQVKDQSQGTEVDPNEALTLPPRLSSSHPSPPTAHRKPHKGETHSKASQVLCSSNILFDKYRQEMQKAGYFSRGTGMTSLVMKPPSQPPLHNHSGKSESIHGELHELAPAPLQLAPQEWTSLYRSPRPRGPQLGLGAVTRQPAAAKTRTMFQTQGQTGQRSGVVTLSHPGQQQAPPGNNQGYRDSTADQRTPGPETTVARTLLPKPGQSRLRPPGFSALPPARLATFGFVRSSSVSSVSSNQSTDSGHSDPCRPSQRPSSGSDDTPLHLSSVAPSHSCPQAPNAPALHRRSLLPPAQVSPTAGRGGSGSRVRGQECEDGIVQKLRERCEDQARQLVSLQAELKKASLGLEAFIITTQYFCHKSESVIVKERELSLELSRIRDEVASSVSQWEILQQDKEELEQRFERELEGLRAQQQSELARLEERLRQYHSLEVQRLEAQQQEQLERLRTQQLEQMEEITENHEAALTEMENSHNDTLVTLKEEHARTVKNLKMAHEQQRKSVEEDFEKLRQSLQDQVDTLTFQNRSLRDRAKRFEEALRRSTDEQIVDALAPYQHIEEDLKSLKEVLLMKNQQIHEQDVKISELERMAQKNVFLEERVQMLHQQNEDLMARIDKNLAMSRQLSEENANLQESMEKESNEKKRLSRNNEELLWRLQSPHMSPTGSPIHRSSAGPGSPARPHSYHQ